MRSVLTLLPIVHHLVERVRPPPPDGPPNSNLHRRHTPILPASPDPLPRPPPVSAGPLSPAATSDTRRDRPARRPPADSRPSPRPSRPPHAPPNTHTTHQSGQPHDQHSKGRWPRQTPHHPQHTATRRQRQ